MSKTNGKTVDWFRIIVDLERASYSHLTIAAAVGVGKRTVGGWKSGSSPRYEDGCLLISLWAQVVAKDQSEIPVISRNDWRA